MCRNYSMIYIKTISSVFWVTIHLQVEFHTLCYIGHSLEYSKYRMVKKNFKKRIKRNLVKDVILLHINSFLRIYTMLITLAQHNKGQCCAMQCDSDGAVLFQMA